MLDAGFLVIVWYLVVSGVGAQRSPLTFAVNTASSSYTLVLSGAVDKQLVIHLAQHNGSSVCPLDLIRVITDSDLHTFSLSQEDKVRIFLLFRPSVSFVLRMCSTVYPHLSVLL